MNFEYLDVLDPYGNKKNIIKLRDEVHQDGDYHRVVHIWIFNNRQEILLQKRSKIKENHPLCWDISCAGHIHAMESSQEGAIRELHEELGLKQDMEDLFFLKTFERFENPVNKEIVDVYLLKLNIDISKLKFVDNEVEDVKYFTISQIKKFINEKAKKFVIREEYFDIIKSIEKGLQS